MNLLYLIGPPAVGKSTLMATLTAGCERSSVVKEPVPHQYLSIAGADRDDVVAVELGGARPGYPGTDTMAMRVSPDACDWMRQGGPMRLLLAEGDRLAHLGFFNAARDGGYDVTVAHLDAPVRVLNARCAERGSNQSLAWRRGRATKSARLAQVAALSGFTVININACNPPRVLASILRGRLPALNVLWSQQHEHSPQ